jgi:hypothetical protein
MGDMVDLKHFGKLPSGTQSDYDKWVLVISVDEPHSTKKFGERRHGILSTVDYSRFVGGEPHEMNNLEYMKMYWKMAQNPTKDNKLSVYKRYYGWGVINHALPTRLASYSDFEGELPDNMKEMFRRAGLPYFSEVKRNITLEQAKNMLRNGTLYFWTLHSDDKFA